MEAECIPAVVDGSCIWLHVRNSLPLLGTADIPRTPIGQAIGLATHTLYSPESETGLLIVGIFNAISAGLLTYASIADLIVEDFLSDESWRVLRGRKRIIASLLVFGGAFGMSLIGAWA